VPVTFPQGVMLARSAERIPSGRALRGGGVYEPKWDGYRGLLFVTDAGVRVQSRRGADLTRAFPDIAAAARRQLPPGVVWTVSSSCGAGTAWTSGRCISG